MIWHTILPYMHDLDDTFAKLYQTFTLSTAHTQPAPRSLYCSKRTDSSMGYATGRLFIDQYFSAEQRNEAEMLGKEIKTSFKDNLPNVKWMDQATRDVAAQKVDAVQEFVGYPTFLTNDTLLNEKYEQLTVNESCHFCNVYSARAEIGYQQRSKLFQKPDHVFEMTADTVNAYYEPAENIIVFPAGILQPPFYHNKGPKALNYGGIGSVVGHELTHGFDDKGRQYDKEGNLKDWWDKQSEENFKERAACLSRQYSSYEIDGVYVDGNQTLGENIADHGGIKMAYNAYQRWRKAGNSDILLPSVPFTSDQLFFIGFAQVWCEKSSVQSVKSHIATDVHSPHRYRVIGTVSDSGEFSAAFNCPLSSPMNPKEKCTIW